MFTSTVLAIPMLFAVNMDFYDLHQVSVDAEGITTHHYMGSDEHVSWVDVRAVEVDEGALFPVMTDDRSLRFVARRHRDFDVPRTDKLYAGFGQTGPSHSDYRYSLQDRSGYLIAYTDERPDGFADTFQLRVSARAYTEERDKQKTGNDTAVFERDDVRSLGLGADWKLTLADRHALTFGFDHYADRVDSTRIDTDTITGTTEEKDGQFAPGAEYMSSGLFIQDELLGLEGEDVLVVA